MGGDLDAGSTSSESDSDDDEERPVRRRRLSEQAKTKCPGSRSTSPERESASGGSSENKSPGRSGPSGSEDSKTKNSRRSPAQTGGSSNGLGIQGLPSLWTTDPEEATDFLGNEAPERAPSLSELEPLSEANSIKETNSEEPEESSQPVQEPPRTPPSSSRKYGYDQLSSPGPTFSPQESPGYPQGFGLDYNDRDIYNTPTESSTGGSFIDPTSTRLCSEGLWPA